MTPYGYYMFRVDHYKVVGLPSGEERAKLTGKEISEAFKAQVLQFYYKLIGLPSGEEGAKLTVEEISKATWQYFMNKKLDGSDDCNLFSLYQSYRILNDPKERRAYDAWLILINCKWFGKGKLINGEEQKQKRGDNYLMSDPDFHIVVDKIGKSSTKWLMSLLVIGCVTCATTLLPVVVVYEVGRRIYRVCRSVPSQIQSALNRPGSFTGHGDCDNIQDWELVNGDCDHIQDWELVNEDDWC